MIIGSLRNGGAERVASRLSNSFEKKGHEVLVVTISSGKVDYPVSRLIELGIFTKNNLLDRIQTLILRFYKIKKIKKGFSPDVTISFMFGANLINAIGRQSNEFIISTIHSSANNEYYNFFKRVANYIIFMKSNVVVSVSQGIMRQTSYNYRLSNNKVRVIYNFVDLNNRAHLRKINRDKITIITIGRLETVKAQWHLIHTVHDLQKSYPNIVLYILGEGSLYDSLKCLILDLKLEKKVFLMGFQADIDKYLMKSDIFCLSSEHEGLSNVIIEAMNVGLPVISTDIPYGPGEILNPEDINKYFFDEITHDHKYGMLVNYGTNSKSNIIGYRDEFIVSQFVNKISTLINNEELYRHYSRQSLKRVQAFSEDKIIQQWLCLMEERKTI